VCSNRCWTDGTTLPWDMSPDFLDVEVGSASVYCFPLSDLSGIPAPLTGAKFAISCASSSAFRTPSRLP
jgi:hypothetical protein